MRDFDHHRLHMTLGDVATIICFVLAMGFGAASIAHAQSGGQDTQAEGFWQRLGTSVMYNRANEKIGRLYFTARLGGVVYDMDRPSQLRAEFVPKLSTVSTDEGIWGGFAIGTGLGYNLRSEAEVSMLALSAKICVRGNTQPNAPDADSLSCLKHDPAVTNIMLHVYYDIDLPALLARDFGAWNHVLPYIGMGVGYSFNKTDINWAADGHEPIDGAAARVYSRLSRETINWSINAGVLLRQVELGYRYLQGPTDIKGHQFFVGYQF